MTRLQFVILTGLIWDSAFLAWDTFFCVYAAAHADIVGMVFFWLAAAVMLFFLFGSARMFTRVRA
jgi:hypothetical protein